MSKNFVRKLLCDALDACLPHARTADEVKLIKEYRHRITAKPQKSHASKTRK